MMLAVLFVGTTFMVNAQTNAPKKGTAEKTEMGKHKKEKKHLSKTKLPKVVTETFITEYPMVTEDMWYTYPDFNYSRDWYDYDQYLVGVENPEYYVVEFTKDKVPHKAVYSKGGKKIAVHKKMKEELPNAVAEAVKKGKYGSWKLASDKEVIFRDTELDKVKTYKVTVEKGKEKHHLYYTTDGELLKDKASK